MSKIDSSYQFLWHPLHKNDTRTHDHTKRALTLIASVAAGVLSLSLAHIIVYALHRRQVKKLPPETRIPSPSQNLSTSSSSENLKMEDPKLQPETPSTSPSNSTLLSDAELARELQAEEDRIGDQYPKQSSTENDPDAKLAQELQAEEERMVEEYSEQSFAEDNPDVILAQELQAEEDEVLSIRLARQLQELENPPVELPPEEDDEEDQDEEMAIARAMSLAEIEKKKREFTAEIEKEKDRIYNLPTDTEEQVTEAYIQMCTQRFPPLLDAEKLCLLGEAFESRAGSNDLFQAKNAYLRAAKQNHTRAHLRLAQGYESGAFGIIDKDKAFEYYIKASLRGNAAAQFWVGKWYQDNRNDDIGAAQSQHYFRLAAKQGHKLAIVELKKLGITIEELKVAEVSVKEVQTKPKEKTNTSFHAPTPPEISEVSKVEEAPSEDVEGTALYTEVPVSVPKTENEITQIIEIADRGNPLAQLIVGNYFEYHSSPPDLEKAKSYFEKAAKGNNLKALYRLALLLEQRVPGNKDYVKAREYLLLAAAQGYAPAETELGDLDVQGLGRKKRSFKEARKHYEEATKQMEPFALIALADLCKKGLGGDYEPDRARMLYEIALKSRLPGAIYGLAECYELGIGGERDLKKALKLYESVTDRPSAIQDKIQKLKAELAR